MTYIDTLSNKYGKEWASLKRAELMSSTNLSVIGENLGSAPLPDTNLDVVVFGSLARNECTLGSDVDWTLLIEKHEGKQNDELLGLIQNAMVKSGMAEPGSTDMFGQTTYGDDLIRHIGGEEDTNRNLSKRLLLLLESRKIRTASSQNSAYERVVAGIIEQYIKHDSGFRASDRWNVPRFLLNDIIRFWRTMCVDFAFKQRSQSGQKWALRNIKLRMARKLIYVKGLLLCFLHYDKTVDPSDVERDLITNVALTPLELMANLFVRENVRENNIIDIFDAYDKYLGILDDEEKRFYLTTLPMVDTYGDKIFEEARANSHKFQKALNNIFIFEHGPIRDFTLNYVIF